MKLSITGLGIVSPAGINKDAFFESLSRGTTGIVQTDKNPLTRQAGIVKDFSVREFTRNFKQARPLSRASHFAIAASTMAAGDGDFLLDETGDHRTGIINATNSQFDDSVTLPFLSAYEKSLDESGKSDSVLFVSRGMRELPAKYPLASIANISTFACSYELSLNGYSNTLTGSNGFFEAIIEADIAMRGKMADRFFCGAADSQVNPTRIIKLIPPGVEQCEHLTRIPGEGAAFFLLEEPSRAEETGSSIYADILSCTGSLFYKPEDMEENIATSLNRAGRTADDIDVIIVSHEADMLCSGPVLESIAGCFSTKKDEIPVSSHLPFTGYAGAAAGAFDLAFSLFILEAGKVPPFLDSPATQSIWPLRFHTEECIAGQYHTILILNIGLTGCLYSVVVEKHINE